MMRSLDEHASDGTTIDIPLFLVTDEEEHGALLSLTLSGLESLKDKHHCTKNVASKYRRKPCMSTSFIREFLKKSV